MNTNGKHLGKKIDVEKAKKSLENLFLIYKEISFNADANCNIHQSPCE